MTKTEQLTAIAERLSEDQIDSLLFFAQSMVDRPFYDEAPPEALASLDRGLQQIDGGEALSLDEVSERLKAAAERSGP